jgi:hypothetical protein
MFFAHEILIVWRFEHRKVTTARDLVPTEVEESLDIWFVPFIGEIIGDVPAFA